MNIKKWLDMNTKSLSGKTVAITGSTGGIGNVLCDYIAALGANLILIDRNSQKSAAFKSELNKKYPKTEITLIKADLESEESVLAACDKLEKMPIDIFIHNAGAYSIPRHNCKNGFDNVYQINFLSPYYMINRLLNTLRKHDGARVIVVGSIAHNYSKSDANNPDFKGVKASSKAYGNAKRYLMFSLYELFKNEKDVALSVTHPGITFTNITAHYPKLIFAIIKNPMKIIFMKPKKAALSILYGLFNSTEYHTWIGPRFFNVWGLPKKQKLKTCSIKESEQIAKTANTALDKYFIN